MRQIEDRYISLLTDFGFKRIFGTAPNKELLICFLNSLFDGKQVIKEVKYLNNEHLGDVYVARKAIFDVYCEGANGEKLEFIYVEIAKFEKSEDELVTLYDKWLYVLKNLSALTNRPKALRDKVFDRLFEEAEIARFTPRELREYEDSCKAYRDLKNSLDTALRQGHAKGLEEGHAQGLEEGLAKGLAKGLEEGLAQGRAEGLAQGEEKASLSIARKMKSQHIAVSVIASCTGLTPEEIENIK